MGGAILYTDFTHNKAKANKHKKKLVQVEQTPKDYLAVLDAQIDRDWRVLGKKPFSREDNDPNGPPTSRMQSTTDPDSGQLHKEGKQDGFHYSEHRTVNSKHNIIVNCHVTAANINDATPLRDILQEMTRWLGEKPKYMGLDAGYHSAPVAWRLEQWGIQAVLGYRRHTYKTPGLGKYRFHYDLTRMYIPIPVSSRCTGEQQTGKDTENTIVIRRYAGSVPDEMSVYRRTRRMGR